MAQSLSKSNRASHLKQLPRDPITALIAEAKTRRTAIAEAGALWRNRLQKEGQQLLMDMLKDGEASVEIEELLEGWQVEQVVKEMVASAVDSLDGLASIGRIQ